MGSMFGVIGAGGSIATLPILIYLFKINPSVATSYSFFIVGTIAAIGSISYIKKGLVKMGDILAFSVPSLIGIFISRHFIVHRFPTVFYGVSKDDIILFLLVAFMMMSAFFMIKKTTLEGDRKKISNINIFISAMLIGLIVGILGAGGGFLIIPALYYFLGVDIKKTVGSSLLIISLNCLAAILIDGININGINQKLLIFTLLSAIFGMIVGLRIEGKISNNNIKRYFGFLTIIIAIIIVCERIII